MQIFNMEGTVLTTGLHGVLQKYSFQAANLILTVEVSGLKHPRTPKTKELLYECHFI